LGGSASATGVQIEGTGTTGQGGTLSLVANNNNILGGTLLLAKSRGTSVGSNTIVQSGDRLGEIYFLGADGSTIDSYGAIIKCEVDGTPGANDMPGRLVFSTTPDNSATPIERMRLDSSGRLGLGTSSPSYTLDVNGTTRLGSGNSAILASVGAAFQANQGELYTLSTNSLGIGTTGAASLNIYTSSTRAITIDSSQRVGIGTTAPDTKANVVKNALTKSWSADTDDVLSVENSGTCNVDFRAGSSSSTYLMFSDGDARARGYAAYLHGSDALLFGAAGSERARIDSSGRVLIGTSTSASAGDAQYGRFFMLANTADATGGAILGLGRNEAATSITAGELLGQLSFTSSNGSEFARISAEADAAAGTNDYPGRLVFSTTADGASSPTERMRISANGNIDYGSFSLTGATQGRRYSDGGRLGRSSVNSTATAPHHEFYNPNGNVGSIQTDGSSTSYNTSSDYRLKENVAPLTGAIERVNDLQVHRFNFLADPSKTVDGFIAHEAQAVVPECVTGTKDEVDDEGNPVYQGIDQSKLVPLLTAALQEAISRIETLEAKVAALETA
jgi:hypothetical protein